MRICQRDIMRRFYLEHRGDTERSVLAYAAAERTGDVSRASDAYNTNALAYGRVLVADGRRRGWLYRLPAGALALNSPAVSEDSDTTCSRG